MKKLFYLLTISLLSSSLFASHMAGGEIWYEFTGDSANPYQYRVWLQFYRDVSGIAAPDDPELCISSSCFPNTSVNFTFAPFIDPGGDTIISNVNYNPNLGGSTAGGNYYDPNNNLIGPGGVIFTPNLEECVDKGSGGTFVQTEIYRYYADVTLNGTCSDWTFAFLENARNPNDNLAGGGTFYIEAKLNNTLGPNSSPVFVNPAAKSFCVGSPFVWSQAATEPDGDSLYFDFGNPLTTTAFSCPATGQIMNFAPGYSKNSPMSTSSGINIDHKTGTFTFTPSQPEVDVINVTVTEYRFDPNLGWLVNGTSVRDLQVPVMSQCKAAAANGPKLDFTAAGFSSQNVDRDSIMNYLSGLGMNNVAIDSSASGGGFDYSMGVIEYDCYDSVIHIEFNIDVLCESFSEKADEFRLVSSTDSVARPIVGVDFECRSDLTTKSVDLLLHKPLDVNGDYFLQVQKGSDGNTLTNRCGFELQEFYTMIIRVENCPELDYRLDNVSVEVDQQVRLDWWVNPQYFLPATEQLFTSWKIFRATGDGPFNFLAELNEPGDVTTRSYTDTSLEMYNLDQSHYRYRVHLVQNHDFRAPTNDVRTILLSDTIKADSSGWDLYWTYYDGWDAPSYEVSYAKVDTTQPNIAWENFDGPDSNFYQTDFIKPNPIDASNEGLYVFKVEATDPLNSSNNHISESNWIYFDLFFNPKEPPTPPEVARTPNVFTPNGDGRNDVFYINAKGFTNASIEVYNRWGNLVFSKDEPKAREETEVLHWDGSDINSGDKLNDGVYYYIVDLQDEQTGEKENLTGQVNIFKD